MIVVRFIKSLLAFLSLSWHGFYITTSHNLFDDPVPGLTIYRFWWGGKQIRDLADIDRLQYDDKDHFYSLLNGRSIRLDKDE